MELIAETNLSIAWAKAFLTAMSSSGGEVSPLIVTVTFDAGEIIETPQIRDLLSQMLSVTKKTGIETVSSTIFPKSLWNPLREKELLFKRYLDSWPRIKKCRTNKTGPYFRRLIDFDNGSSPVNQLKHIIETWQNGNHRHSALQAAIFDPRLDHTDQRQLGFPCLHQVAFNPMGSNGKDGLAVTGFYAKQLLFEKAYGNYLGLCRLGQFMAHEMNIKFKKIVCIANIAEKGKETKNSLSAFEDKLTKILNKLE